jgi:ornithine cyclodeaminase/alanine dehydrogenase-like protein (mu-crystallin family)
MPDATMLLRRRDVANHLTLDACIVAVEDAFAKLGRKEVPPPGILGLPAAAGGFHIKAALLDHAGRKYFAAKCNANFSDNMGRFGLPAIQGVIILCDAESGYPLAVMDSIEITILRTAAATAVAAKHLARPESETATICGCGNQGRAQLRALTRVLPIKRVFAVDSNPDAAKRFVSEVGQEPGIRMEVAADLRSALGASDVCVTCTPSRRALILAKDVRPGTFIAAVGADSPEKQELDPELLRTGTLVVDVLEQCATIGELHHALDVGLLSRDCVYAELGEIVAGIRPGRTTSDEITIFDSTGTAIQDAAAAIAVYTSIADDADATRINFNS